MWAAVISSYDLVLLATALLVCAPDLPRGVGDANNFECALSLNLTCDKDLRWKPNLYSFPSGHSLRPLKLLGRVTLTPSLSCSVPTWNLGLSPKCSSAPVLHFPLGQIIKIKRLKIQSATVIKYTFCQLQQIVPHDPCCLYYVWTKKKITHRPWLCKRGKTQSVDLSWSMSCFRSTGGVSFVCQNLRLYL